MMRTLKDLSLACGAAAAIVLAGCASTSDRGGPVPVSYTHGTILDRQAISVAEQTRYLEVSLNPADSQLRLAEREKIRAFVAEYRRSGHGPLVMSLPAHHANEELAVAAIAEAREIAWSSGVDYEKIQGSAYEADGRAGAPVVLAFKSYDALAPACPQKAAFDFSNATSNNDMPTLGCSVRTNMAAMIADPADLFGDRPLEEGDRVRRDEQLQLYRDGAITAADRNDQESGSVSTAVN